MDNRPVGVYDSGLGGLTVWREIRRQLPEESLVYLGDGKNCPYGARPADEICRLADEAVGRLVGAGCKWSSSPAIRLRLRPSIFCAANIGRCLSWGWNPP